MVTLAENRTIVLSSFVTSDEQIFASSDNPSNRVDRWAFNGTSRSSSIPVSATCFGISIDTNDSLYCSQYNAHRVTRQPLRNTSSQITVLAGTGLSGSAANTLNSPVGIFVTLSFGLYAVLLIRRTIEFNSFDLLARPTVPTGSIVLFYPTAVVLDGDEHLFITDKYNNRVIGSGPWDFRCVVGCTGPVGSASNQLQTPRSIAFDSAGNLFVMDEGNNRLQKCFLNVDSFARKSKKRWKNHHHL